jgi:general L-amino acid transport system permease protein
MSASSEVFAGIPSRPPPIATEGVLPWLKRNLFSDWKNSLGTVVVLVLLARYLPPLVDWAVFNAVARPDNAACRAIGHEGACWGVIAEKYRLILFGRYPYDEQWRPLVATTMMIALLVASCYRPFWSRWLIVAWTVVLAAFFWLMLGGILGLSYVETARWGGFPLTIMLSTIGLATAFPLSIAVALGRRSRMPGIRTLCVLYVELIRGVPLISVLFMASFMFPLFMPAGMTIDVLVRVQVGITLFSAAYLAEVVRGGLQALPRGQIEAAQSLGLSYWQTTRKIVLPQALRLVVPAIMNTFIGTFKDTSLVTIVSLYDLTGALQLALGDSNWRKFFLEGQLFVAAVYFVCCFAMSRYSQWIERHLNTGTRRQ